jgi:hypothetical protein
MSLLIVVIRLLMRGPLSLSLCGHYVTSFTLSDYLVKDIIKQRARIGWQIVRGAIVVDVRLFGGVQNSVRRKRIIKSKMLF